MKILLIFLTLTQIVSCQNVENDKISIAFIKPDSLRIDSSLEKYTEIVTNEYQQRNSKLKEELTEFLKSQNEFELIDSNEFKELKKSARLELKKIDSLDIASRNFNYYEYLTYYSKSILRIAVEQKGDLFEISENEQSKHQKLELESLAKNKNYDFIIKFVNLQTIKKNDSIFLVSNVILYSSKTNSVILEKEIEGSTQNNDEYLPCQNPLSCLFKNLSKNALKVYLPRIAQEL